MKSILYYRLAVDTVEDADVHVRAHPTERPPTHPHTLLSLSSHPNRTLVEELRGVVRS